MLFGCIPPLKIISRIQKLFDKKWNPFNTLKKCPSPDLTTRQFNVEQMSDSIQPVGIINSSRNCWCISALQLLCNTPIHAAMVHSKKFSTDFPEITKFMKVYHKTYSSSILLGEMIQYIRKELYQKLSDNFREQISEPADAIEFLNLLLGRYTFGQEFKLSCSPINLATILSTSEEKYLFIETTPLPSQLKVEELFSSTPYELLGLIFYRTDCKHYLASVKVDGKWYKCNDQEIMKIDRTDLTLEKEIVLLMAFQKQIL